MDGKKKFEVWLNTVTGDEKKFWIEKSQQIETWRSRMMGSFSEQSNTGRIVILR